MFGNESVILPLPPECLTLYLYICLYVCTLLKTFSPFYLTGIIYLYLDLLGSFFFMIQIPRCLPVCVKFCLCKVSLFSFGHYTLKLQGLVASKKATASLNLSLIWIQNLVL